MPRRSVPPMYGGSHADPGLKHVPRRSHKKAEALRTHCAAKHQAVNASAYRRTIMLVQNRLAKTATLPKS